MAQDRTFYTEQIPQSSSPIAADHIAKIQEKELAAESVLEGGIKSARLQLIKYLEVSKDVYITQSQRYFETEREINSTISSLHDRREDLLPNAIYVLTGGILGSVVTRRSNILLRLVSPLVFGVVSFKYFMPLTFERTFTFASDIEKSKLPNVYQTQTDMINKADDLVKQTSELAEAQQKSVNSFFNSAKKFIGDWSGLKVDQIVTEKKK